MVAFEVAGWLRISNLGTQNAWPRFEILSLPATSKAAMSAPECRICKFDPPFDAPGSGLSSALQINILRQTRERVDAFY